MPRQNRVTPYGERLAVADRGMFWGNRGRLHDASGNIVRYSQGRAWAVCVLEFKGRRRRLMAPGRLTELFFLDEATALAAGHRPCGECRSSEYRAFKAAWLAAHPDDAPSVHAIDAHLHGDRLVRPGVRRTWRARLEELPDGTFVDLDGEPWLVRGSALLAWRPGGYGERRRRFRGEATVITPKGMVAVLGLGYEPVVHPGSQLGVR